MKTIIAHPRFDELADELVRRRPGEIKKHPISIISEAGKWNNISLENPHEITGEDVTIIGDYSRPEDLYEQLALVRGIQERHARKIRVICPYFPVGTMERISKKGEVATAKYFADLISQFSPESSSVKFHSISSVEALPPQIGKSVIAHTNTSSILAQIPGLDSVNSLIDVFEDGWPKIFINEEKEKVEHKDVVYLADFSDPKNFFQEYALMRSIIDYYADSLTVVVSRLPEFASVSVKQFDMMRFYVDVLGSLPPGRKRATEVYIHNPSGRAIPSPSAPSTSSPFGGLQEKPSIHTFDIHALVERFIFDASKVNVELHTALSLIHLDPDIAIAFPDDGAAKRFAESFPDNKDRIICIKVRGDGNKREITIKEGDPEGKDIIIVDDLIQTGGTLREAVKVLRARGAKSVRAFAPHGVFPRDSHRELAKELDELIVTDTIPANIERAKPVKNMRVLSIAPLIEKILIRA